MLYPKKLSKFRKIHNIPWYVWRGVFACSALALLGLIGYATVGLPIAEPDGEVYAETLNTNTSLIIDNGTATDSTATVRTGVAYSSHTVQVKADNITGYTLSITGPASLSNGSTTIGGAGGKTGTQLASADTGWGYGWNTTSTTNANMAYNSFSGSAQTLSGDSVSNNSVNFTRKLVFAAKFSQNAAEGHYRANVKLNLTVTPKTVTTYSYSVTYSSTGHTSGSVPAKQTAESSATSYNFSASNQGTLVRTGYVFQGWATTSGSSTVAYTAGSTISLTSGSPSKTLYAVWKQDVLTWDTITKMQDMTAAICNSASTGASKTLTDTRDNGASSYVIRKLADGNCWMTTNLTLDLSKAGVATVAESDNLSSAYPATALTNRFDTASTNAWQNDKTVAQFSKEPKKISSGSYQSGSGYFYSFKAATAATIADTATSGDASGSICPKGWKLPKGGSSGDFQALYNKYNNNQVSANKRILLGASTEAAGGTYFPAAGYVDSYGLSYGGTNGYYWSRTVYDSGNSYNLYFASSSISPAYNNGKYRGLSVRCVAYSS